MDVILRKDSQGNPTNKRISIQAARKYLKNNGYEKTMNRYAFPDSMQVTTSIRIKNEVKKDRRLNKNAALRDMRLPDFQHPELRDRNAEEREIKITFWGYWSNEKKNEYRAVRGRAEKTFIPHDGGWLFELTNFILVTTTVKNVREMTINRFIKVANGENPSVSSIDPMPATLNILTENKEFSYKWENGVRLYTNYIKVEIERQPKDLGTFGMNGKYRGGIENVTSEYARVPVNKRASNFTDFLMKQQPDWYKPNSCLFTIWLETYRDVILKKGPLVCKCKKWLKTHSLTYDGLIDGHDGGELSPNELIPLMRILSIGLCCIDAPTGNVIGGYHPLMDGKGFNQHINPQTLYIIIHNGHAFKCNKLDRIKELYTFDESVMMWRKKQQNYDQDDVISSPYPSLFVRDLNAKMISCLDDIIGHFNNGIKSFVYNGNLKNLCIELIEKYGYSPKIKLDGTMIRSVHLNFEDDFISISNYCEDGEKFDCSLELMEIENKLDFQYLNDKNKSEYSKNTLDLFRKFMPKPSVMGFGQGWQGGFKAYDMNKFYTSILLKYMPAFPVLSLFDEAEYDTSEKIENYNMYFLERIGEYDPKNILTFQPYIMLMGEDYIKYKHLFKVLRVIKPSRLAIHDTSKLEEILKSTDYIESNIKQGVNRVIGRFNKSKGEKNTAMIFIDQSEAYHFARDRRTKAYNISEGAQKLWVVNIKSAKYEYRSGFVPMYAMLQSKAISIMQEIYENMLACGVEVYGIKTDCFFVKNDVNSLVFEKKFRKMFKWDNFYSSIGKLKIESDNLGHREFGRSKGLKPPKFKFDMVSMAKEITMKDEYDPVERNSLIDGVGTCFVSAHFPGAGKSHACKKYSYTKGLKMLIVSNDRAIQSEFEKEGYAFMTLNELFGLNLNDKYAHKGKEMEALTYDVICFEELLKANLRKLEYVKRFVDKYKGKIKILGNGDNCQIINQIEDERKYNNTGNFAKYKMDCIRKIFDCNMHLNLAKRMQDPTDRELLNDIKTDLFDKGLSVRNVAEKYIKRVNEGLDGCDLSDQFITYTNMCAWSIRGKSGRGDFSVGDVVVCRSYLGRKDVTINMKYEIMSIEDKKVSIKNIISEQSCEITKYALFHYFEPDGIITAHSAQGKTLEGDVYICEYDAPFCNDIRWFWAAITRATTFKNIVLVKNMDSYTRQDMLSMISEKITAHKKQDADNGSKIVPFQYVDKQYLYDIVRTSKMRCRCCNNALGIKDVEFDRIDNRWGLVKGNVQILCLPCNRRKGCAEKNRDCN